MPVTLTLNKNGTEVCWSNKSGLSRSSLQHIISNSPAKSTEIQPSITIPPALHLHHSNFDLLNELPNEEKMCKDQLHQLVKNLRLELDFAQLHVSELDKSVWTLQAQLVIENAATSSRSNYMRRKGKRRRTT